MLYKLLWSNKTDKITKETLPKKYLESGLNVQNLGHFFSALNISWMAEIIFKRKDYI